ncbi:MAG: hypothetical protein ACKO87_02790 [Dolichospermum sp.]
MKIPEQEFDCTQREFIEDICWIIYSRLGYSNRQEPGYFFASQHPTEISVLAAAEEIFEFLTSDTPDYDDEIDD